MNKVFLISSVFICISVAALSQSHKKQLEGEEINVIAPYEPTISDAIKISETPVIADTVIEQPKLTYSIESRPVVTIFKTEPISPAKMVGDPLSKLYKNYLKLGFGNNFTPLGEYYINNLRSKSLLIGGNIRHFSSEGNIMKYGKSSFSDNDASAYVRKYFKNYIASSSLDFKRNVVHYYGYNDTIPERYLMRYYDTLGTKNDKQRYAMIAWSGELASNMPDSSKYFNHTLKTNFYYLWDKYDASETNLNINSLLSKRFNFHKKTGDRVFLLNSTVDFFNNKNASFDNNSALISLTPQMRDTYKEFRIEAGLDATLLNDTATKFYFYPNVEVNAYIVKNILTLYFGTSGKLQKNSIRSMINENPFIASTITTDYTNYKFKLYGGLKGSISSYVSFNVNVSNTNIDHMGFFVNDTAAQFMNRFLMVYDDVDLFCISGQISAQFSEKAKFLLNSEYRNFTMKHELEPWHEPNLKLALSLYYNLGDKLIFKGDAYSFGESYAKGYIMHNGQNIVKPYTVLGIVDFNFGLEYRYTKILSAFITLNNIEGIKHTRYYNYPQQGFNFIGGVSYSF